MGFVAIVPLLSGCAAPPDRPPETAVALTGEYSRSLGHPSEITSSPEIMPTEWLSWPWWDYYSDPDLNFLINDALASNPGINQIRKRLEQAAANTKLSFSDLVPSATTSGNRSADRGDNESPSTYNLSGTVSYELDLWGGNRASHKSDSLEAEAGTEDVHAATINLSTSIVDNWLRLLALREEESLLQSQIATNGLVLHLQHKRFENGISGALDVLQQTELLERTKGQLPDIQEEQEIILHRLAVLTGKNPSTGLNINGQELPKMLPIPDAGIPAQLLENRPDIVAAWLRVTAADWATEAARINRLPNFDISSVYSTSSTKFKNLFESWALDVVLGLAMPILDGGERVAQQVRQKALADERFLDYQETVLTAIGEVEDTLTRNHHQAEKIKTIENQLYVSRNTLERTTISYHNGNADYISVLNSLSSAQTLEQQLLRARRDLALERVALYKALGLKTEPPPRKTKQNDAPETDTPEPAPAMLPNDTALISDTIAMLGNAHD